MKRVAVVYSGARYFGGIETYLENLFEHYDRSEMKLTLFSMGEWDLTDRLKASGERPVVLDSRRLRPRTIRELAAHLVEGGFDLVVTQGTVANLYGRRAARRAGLPVVTAVHSEPRGDYDNALLRALYGLVDHLTRGATTRFIAVSEHIADLLESDGIPRKSITVIHNGVAPVPDVVGARHREGPVVLGSVGRLHPVKNYPALIEACSLLRRDDWRLVIYGEGPQRSELEQLVARTGLSDKVTLPGYVDDLSQAFSAIDIYVQPSLAEGFGLAVVEAMAAGKPVVVTPVGGLSEIVVDRETGIVAKGTDLTDIADALRVALEDEGLRAAIAEAGRASVLDRFSQSRWLEETGRVYLETARTR